MFHVSKIATSLATSFFCPSSCSMPCGTSNVPITGDEPQQPMAEAKRLAKRVEGLAVETAGVGLAKDGNGNGTQLVGG